MVQSMKTQNMVGDYVVEKQIGIGSFSTVWHARHRVHGTEVAIKEIVTDHLDSKLQESLKSEIFILKRINHPNIIHLHHMIEEPGKMYIVLDYCKGGDLSKYLLRHQGRVHEATAKQFMQQLAEGLKVLRENKIIHRDLKPQNLLLSTGDGNGILKIADFGFARSLQSRGLAETICGSPLYMAPEIMQSKKYDAKADLWSVGAILFQLVTGKVPFTGNSPIQLLQNIIKSTDLQFPPSAKNLNPQCVDLCKKLLKRNPVERLTFEEFFNHPYISQLQPENSFRKKQSRQESDDLPQEDCLLFSLDDDFNGEGIPFSGRRSTIKSKFGDTEPKQNDIDNVANRADSSIYSRTPQKTITPPGSSFGFHQLSEGNRDQPKLNDINNVANRAYSSIYSRTPQKTTTPPGSSFAFHQLSEGDRDLVLQNKHLKVVDSHESVSQDYVIVPGLPKNLSSSEHVSTKSDISSKNVSPPLYSAPIILGAAAGRVDHARSQDIQFSADGISQESMGLTGSLEKPLTNSLTRISSLQCCAAAISELVNNKIKGGMQLEAFSVQLVVLAVWRQALHICHAHAASAIEGTVSQVAQKLGEASNVHHILDVEKININKTPRLLDIYSQIEKEFLHEVGLAEELAKVIDPGNMKMPDAMELIYQSALELGKNGAVDEYMGNMDSALVSYSKAVCLLQFLLVEASCLILNHPFPLTSSDRYRIQSYIDVLNNRQNIMQSQRNGF